MTSGLKTQDPASPPFAGRGSLSELAVLFLKLGTVAFGGPAAHIAMIEEEVVRRRGWLSHAEFLDMLGATNLIPGPNSTEMAIHIGYQRAGLRGLAVAGICFIVPATIIVTSLAWAYTHFGQLPVAEGLLYGVKPVVIAVVIQALWGLGRVAIKSKFLASVGVIAVGFGLMGVNEMLILFGAAVVVAAGEWAITRYKSLSGGLPVLLLPTTSSSIPSSVAATASGAALAVTAVTKAALWPIFFIFLKIGSILFGSGYVLLAFLRADLVERLGWLSETQLLDAVAVGQITPGPVFTTATFIGYLLAGPGGAIVATVGIFLPAFFFVAVSAPIIPHLRRSSVASRLLDGLNLASLSLMFVVTWHLARAAVVDRTTTLFAVSSAFLLLRFKVNSAWLVLGGAMGGVITHWVLIR
ncbi:MAG: chromate efflux transporter [Candidatus Sumerlaeaceae bacterium]|nr:chromate efflux transporter [Candidatus Sumerlaeaceae bacterium]